MHDASHTLTQRALVGAATSAKLATTDALAALFIVRGAKLVLGDLTRYLDIVQRRPGLALIYKWHFILWLAYLCVSFVFIYFAPSPKQPRQPPAKVQDKTISALPLIGVAALPLIPLVIKSIGAVAKYTWTSREMDEKWWSRKLLSWAGGPVWRYGGALLLGFRQYHHLEPQAPWLLPNVVTRTFTKDGVTWAYDEPICPRLAVPSIEPLLLVLAAFIVWTIGLAMIFIMVMNARKGLSTVQVERIKRWHASGSGSMKDEYDPRLRLWIPLPHDESTDSESRQGTIMLVNPDTPLFDHGAHRNWHELMGGTSWVDWCIPWRLSHVDDLVINPNVLKQLQDEARKRAR
ncbi:hypothetical protein OIO90_005065 [Microbotryomycetes sp. JL221]|nr:hypothetical protein OIO90_005065 [Microbotryomycetes sp. JL221]